MRDNSTVENSDLENLPEAFRNRKWKSSIGIMDFAGCVSKNTARKIRKFVEETDNAYEDS